MFACICAHFQTTRNISSKKIFLTVRSGVKNVFWCICAYFQTTRNCYLMKWLKTCFDAFAHTSIPLEPFFRKIYFLPSGVVRNVLCAYLRQPETFFQKRYFLPSGVVKNVFNAFAHAYRPPVTFFQKRYFLTSGVVKNMFWCICEYI